MFFLNRIGIFLLVAILSNIACSATNSTPSQIPTDGNADISGSSIGIGNGTTQPRSLNAIAGVASGNISGGTLGERGILVVGTGSIQLEPDLALLTIGVESRGKMVSAAQAKASVAMEAIITSLGSEGVSKDDMRTQRFDIQPIISYRGSPNPVQQIDGYKVSNTLVVRISDIDRVGEMIDSAVSAGGDMTRVQSVSFVAEDQSMARIQARTLATEDAIAKASQFAGLLSINVGQPIFVSELGSNTGGARTYSLERFAMADASVVGSTVPILAGEIDVTSQVQVLFSIE
ncbi:SIMPL domain-containing protein [Dehalococcoidia bacterium]|nr:SIMPL domain-containing protein [Dehalococcoidia bacterium]